MVHVSFFLTGAANNTRALAQMLRLRLRLRTISFSSA
jgi:hypothetical protein